MMNLTLPGNATELAPVGKELIRVSASIYGAFIIVFGTIGNMISLRIFWNADVFKESTHVLLIVLQVADSCVLLLVVTRYWIEQAFRLDIRNLSYPVCLIHVALTYLCVDLAIWILVLIVLDRFLAVTYPIRARLIMTKGNVLKILVALLALLCAKDLPLLFSHYWRPGDTMPCMYRENFFKYYLVADSFLNFLLPDSLLLIFNLAIFFSIRRHTRLMAEAATAATGRSSSVQAAQPLSGGGRKRSQDNRQRQLSVARVALVSGTIHLVTTMPSAAYLLSHAFVTYSGRSFLVNNLLQMLSYTNSAINFLIYLPIDARFRTGFNSMITPECSNAANNSNWLPGRGRAPSKQAAARQNLLLTTPTRSIQQLQPPVDEDAAGTDEAH